MAQKVLVIDDDPYIRELYEEILKDASYTVDTAENGTIGMEKMTNGQYDVIFLDVMMPNIDGITVLKTLVQKQQKVHGTIILLTNLAQDPVIKEALTLGATSYLIKSDITPDQLVLAVKQHTSSQQPT